MNAIPQGFNYEIHRPSSYLALQVLSTALLSDREKRAFADALTRAGRRTGGPLMKDGGVSCSTADDLEDAYWSSLKEGVSPCYVDRRDGYVYLGEYVFVPSKIPILVRPEDVEK
jgi:hypothetical protein